MADILVIRTSMVLSARELARLRKNILTQKETGLVLLPPWCDVQVVPKDIKIAIEEKGENK